MKKRSIAVLLLMILTVSLLFPQATQANFEAPAIEVVIQPQYALARDFSDGRAAVFNGQKWGYIDTTGTLVTDYLYDIAGDYAEGVAAVATVVKGGLEKTPDVETWYLIDMDGRVVSEEGVNNRYSASQPTYITSVVNGTYIKSPGAEAKATIQSIRPGNTTLPVTRFTRGHAYAEGYMVVSTDATGKFSLPSAIAQAEAGAKPDSRGDMLIDFNGKILWQPDWGMLLPPNRGLVPAHSRTTGLWGFADFTGQYVIEPMYEDFWYAYRNGAFEIFADGVAALYKDGTYYAVDTGGKVLFSTQNLLGLHGEGLLPISMNGKYGYCDLQGITVIEPEYKTAQPFRNGVALVETPGGFYFINKKGVRLNPLPYTDAGVFSDGLARVQIMGKYGYVRINGRLPDSQNDRPNQGWAQAELDAAYSYGLLPTSLAARYQTGITRTEMAQLTVTLLTRLSDQTVEELVLAKTGQTLQDHVKAYNFTDSADPYVVAAAALGIVNGVGDGRFLPHAAIIRQDAAAMLMRTAKLAGLSPKLIPAEYADRSAIASWAVESVNYVTTLGIMGGVGHNKFEPRGTYTREQAIATIKRIYEMVNP